MRSNSKTPHSAAHARAALAFALLRRPSLAPSTSIDDAIIESNEIKLVSRREMKT